MKESQNIEFKRSWRDEYLKWICGFANAQGGELFIGLDDKGEGRELHTELALDAIDYNHCENYKTPYEVLLNRSSQVIDCNYFSINYLKINQPVGKDFNYIDSFVIYICLSGSLLIEYENNSEPVQAGESVLIPAMLKNLFLRPEGESEMLEVFIKNPAV